MDVTGPLPAHVTNTAKVWVFELKSPHPSQVLAGLKPHNIGLLCESAAVTDAHLCPRAPSYLYRINQQASRIR